ncbi:NADH:flavin oxidoreductase [Desulfomonile tiedjei]|uniref:NADH:flavin oxidoreductase n=1 Tax=Desulfomonile tiedjei (strain ATCC 49306 / DSM 6799 / DCB-1) TaxID=706587 RepID=I4C5U4_DESTA|nr:NADH:flavin oxidoreductase [Desulfomonile tiedjei]AFM24935.1 NADH:flavin oxidoreductase [Desulfomonile tiedjei DSM 6799]
MKLFENYSLKDKLTLNNRIMMPPVVTRLATSEGHVTDALVDRYVLYAKGGAGLVVTEAVSVKKQKSGQLLRLNDDEFIPGLKKLTQTVHDESEAKIAPQIIHFLKISRSGYRQKVEDLTLEEIKEIPTLFAQAAERACRAGFDAVELHFAHSYTMSSFLSRHNHRTDEYGGSLKKRLRLAEEVVTASRKAVGDNFVLGARINGDEFTLGGNSLEQSSAIAVRLAELGLDYISVSAGGKFEDAIPKEGESLDPYTGYSGNRSMPPKWMPEKVNVYLAANIKKALMAAGYDTTVVTAGRIPTAQIAEGVLQNGEADLIAIARPILCDPYWPKKSKEGREDEILKCIYCNKCREAEGSFEEVTCIQWKKKDGIVQIPKS